ncbi:MEMBRANE-ASSOCIATED PROGESTERONE RECEPTOR COMPONENT-RELATED [Salix purpurea]|uniref:MEMBRANE-ASSOCIATED PROGESTERONE RECEPTOR COMPONENT-RELATED n=1 Tax=Salix purpurea TaxID=77065 RepID=A0A9Q1ALN7_SALPP|nr:MEMBRANE-ASSOCIATED PROGESTERONE RECEPTOR COMPONENT-RELATED [Salix purpurea]
MLYFLSLLEMMHVLLMRAHCIISNLWLCRQLLSSQYASINSLTFIENEIIRLLSFVPGLATVLPKLVAKLQIIRNKYMAPTPTVSNVAVGKWDFSFASIWNAVILLMLTTFIIKIVTATAQSFLKEQQEKELALYNSSFASSSSSSKTI